MRKQPKISILIPIFNVEKYLKECLDSIILQTLKDIEIICINDGSTDQSLSIIQSFMNKDSRIKLINKSNSGYGDSMNQGLKAATGKYIGIIESDDIAKKSMFKTLYTHAKKESFPDIVKADYHKYWSEKKETLRCSLNLHHLYNKVFKPLKQMSIFNSTPSIWSGIYKTELIKKHNILFNPTPGASYQDKSFQFKVFALAQSMLYINKSVLYYRQDNEASSVNNPAKIYCICDEYAHIDAFLEKNPKIKTKIKKHLNVLKTSSYLWNYERLAPDYKNEFLKQFQKEIKKEKQNLKKNLFEKNNWKLLLALLKSKKQFQKEYETQKQSYLLPYVIKLEKKMKKSLQKNFIVYGFNELGKLICDSQQVTYIIDRNSKETEYQSIPINSFEAFDSYNNEVFVITSINNKFVKEIKNTIKTQFKNAKIISL